MGSLRFGVNYVPREKWWYAWVDWDEASITGDLETIASLGMDHIRIHCLWSVFQPDSGVVSAVAVQRLVRLVEVAGNLGLDVWVTVLDGWLSGFEFYPAWLQTANMFSDRTVIAAEKRLFGELGHALRGAPNFAGFDLGNELGVLQTKQNPAESGVADAWQAEMLAWCDSVAPAKLHVNGVDHLHWFTNHGFSRHALATQGAMTVLHSWAFFTGAMERYGPRGTGSLHLVEYQAELAKAYHDELGRPIWCQEIGASEQWMPLAEIPDYAEISVRNALSSADVWGITWWCSHDLQPQLADFDPLEYDLGLIDAQGRIKPLGERLRALIHEFRKDPPKPETRTVGLILRESAFDGPTFPVTWKLGSAFMDLVDQGIRPAIVHEDRATDTEYLKSRGITDLVG